VNRILDFLESNWGAILLGIGIFYIIFYKRVNRFIFRRKKKEEEYEYVPLPDPVYQGKEFDMGSNLNAQQKSLEAELKQIGAEGKAAVKEERELDSEYRKKKEMLDFRKRQLKIKYTMQVTQLENVKQMIVNQQRMDEMLKKEAEPPRDEKGRFLGK